MKIKSKISRLTIFISVFVLMLLFYGLSIRDESRLPWHQQVVVTLVTPFQKSVTFIGKSVSDIWNGYFDLVSIADENRILKEKIAKQTYDLKQVGGLESENSRLRMLLSFKDRHNLEVVGADVIANDPRSDFRVVTIDKGSKDQVITNMPVVASKGLVGKIGDSSDEISRVLLITDPNSSVDVMVQRSRARALLVGSKTGTKLSRGYYLSRLEYLDRKSDIKEGDLIVTSGLDGIFPSGIPVGEIKRIKENKHGLFKNAIVVPFVDFTNLEELLIVKR